MAWFRGVVDCQAINMGTGAQYVSPVDTVVPFPVEDKE
jgi:hypothetical protein